MTETTYKQITQIEVGKFYKNAIDETIEIKSCEVITLSPSEWMTVYTGFVEMSQGYGLYTSNGNGIQILRRSSGANVTDNLISEIVNSD